MSVVDKVKELLKGETTIATGNEGPGVIPGSTIVGATGVASATLGSPTGVSRSKFMAAAMQKAVEDCYAKGITNPDMVRQVIWDYREKAKEALRLADKLTAELLQKQLSEQK